MNKKWWHQRQIAIHSNWSLIIKSFLPHFLTFSNLKQFPSTQSFKMDWIELKTWTSNLNNLPRKDNKWCSKTHIWILFSKNKNPIYPWTISSQLFLHKALKRTRSSESGPYSNVFFILQNRKEIVHSWISLKEKRNLLV